MTRLPVLECYELVGKSSGKWWHIYCSVACKFYKKIIVRGPDKSYDKQLILNNDCCEVPKLSRHPSKIIFIAL